MAMKKIVLLIAVLSSISFASVAQSTDSTNVAEISFVSTEIDYGMIEKGAEGTKIVEFTNIGKLPLVLSNVSPSCGCTVAEWTKDPVKPGEKGSITIKYNTNLVGPFHKSVRVFSNSKVSPTMIIIKGEVKPSKDDTSQIHE
jgi:hypothetical protein